MDPAAAPKPESASLVVIDSSNHHRRVPLNPLPFRIGRQPDSDLVLRDSRVSRVHARILFENGSYEIEDCGSRHGTFVNGQRIERHTLRNSDRIDCGAHDGYHLVFALDGAELKRLMEQVAAGSGTGGNLARLRSILELARTLQHALSIDEVLASLVDAALAITSAERGFLLLKNGDELEIRVARGRDGRHLADSDLRVPRHVIHRALHHRRELLSMTFDAAEAGGAHLDRSISDLELRSVVCVPLVRIRTTRVEATSVLSTADETVGVLYMDSRVAAADLAGGNRELLQTLAIEASTVLENARLLEEERRAEKIEEELLLARSIQRSLLPSILPETGWLRAAGSSVPSREVGGDYFDVAQVNAACWSAVVADVSGKGVSSALLASLLQGALLAATDHPEALLRRTERLNGFLLARTGGEKYATVFYSLLHQDGRVDYVNAAHCPPILLKPTGEQVMLPATGMPLGLVEGADFQLAECRLTPKDKLIIYTDGITEAQNPAGEFFGKSRLKAVLEAHATDSCAELYLAIQKAVTAFINRAPQADDITLLVLEYSE
jgi:serine phosphatase RsbU (regulator of sigma subunit)